jgi:hypothetical protein
VRAEDGPIRSRASLDEAFVRRDPRRLLGGDQEECAGRLSEDPRLVSVRRSGSLAARKGRIAMTWREMVSWGRGGARRRHGHLGRGGEGRHVRSAHRSERSIHRSCGDVGLHQQDQGLKRDGPSAFATRAVRGGHCRWYLLLETPTQQPFDATHLLNQRGAPYRCFAERIGRSCDDEQAGDHADSAHVRCEGGAGAYATN